MLSRIVLLSAFFALFATPCFGQGEFESIPKLQHKGVGVRPETFRPQAVAPKVPPSSKLPGYNRPRFDYSRVLPKQWSQQPPTQSPPAMRQPRWRPQPQQRWPQPSPQPPTQRWGTPRPQPPRVARPTIPPQWRTPRSNPPTRTWPRPSSPDSIVRRWPTPTVPPQAQPYPQPPQVVQPNPTPTVPSIPSQPRLPAPSLPTPTPKPGKIADDNFRVPKPFPGFDEGEGPTKLDGGPLDGLKNLGDLRDQLAEAGKDKFKPFDHNKFLRKFDDLFGPGGLDKTDPKQFGDAKQNMILSLSLNPYCHWWCDFTMHCHWHWHGCYWWDCCYMPGYWQCWTPCHYQVIYCPPTPTCVARSWYLGLDCILVPDLAAFGVTDVAAGSPAAVAGIEPGDLIVAVNQKSITDETVLANNIQNSNGVIELAVLRDGMDEPVWLEIAMELVMTH